MQIKLAPSNFFLNTDFKPEDIHEKIPVLFLHGFTGSMQDWAFVKNNLPQGFAPVFIDIIGHGQSSSPREIEFYTPESQISLINSITEKLAIKRFILTGYSMGGRLAVLYTLKYPDKILGLILESTSFGIKEQDKRLERLNSDREVAEMIEKGTKEDFIDFWLDLPLFNSLKNVSEERLKILRENKLKYFNPTGLKNSLLGFGTGKMKYLIPKLSKLEQSVFLIAGELDKKFADISLLALEQIRFSELEIVKNSGHNVHFEKPEVFLKLVNNYLLKVEKIDEI